MNTTGKSIREPLLSSDLHRDYSSQEFSVLPLMKNRYLGLYLILLSLVIYNITLTLVKVIMNGNDSITSLEIMLARYICIALFNSPFLWWYGEKPWEIDRDSLKIFKFRFGIDFITWLLMYYSLEYLPVGLVIAI